MTDHDCADWLVFPDRVCVKCAWQACAAPRREGARRIRAQRPPRWRANVRIDERTKR